MFMENRQEGLATLCVRGSIFASYRTCGYNKDEYFLAVSMRFADILILLRYLELCFRRGKSPDQGILLLDANEDDPTGINWAPTLTEETPTKARLSKTKSNKKHIAKTRNSIVKP